MWAWRMCPYLQRQLLLRLLHRHALVQEAVEHAHQPGAVGAGLAVHHHRIFDLFEQPLGALQLLARRRRPRTDLEIDQLHAELLAGAALQVVGAAIALAAQVHDRTDAGLGVAPQLMGRRLRRPPGFVGETMAVAIDDAEDAVVDKQHVEIRRRRPSGAAQPLGRGPHGALAEAASNAPPGAFSPLHQSGHQSPLIFRVSSAGRKPEHR